MKIIAAAIAALTLAAPASSGVTVVNEISLPTRAWTHLIFTPDEGNPTTSKNPMIYDLVVDLVPGVYKLGYRVSGNDYRFDGFWGDTYKTNGSPAYGCWAWSDSDHIKNNQIGSHGYCDIWPGEKLPLLRVYMGDFSGPVNVTAWIYNVQLESSAPEPATWALMISGFGLVGMAARRRQRISPSWQKVPGSGK